MRQEKKGVGIEAPMGVATPSSRTSVSLCAHARVARMLMAHMILAHMANMYYIRTARADMAIGMAYAAMTLKRPRRCGSVVELLPFYPAGAGSNHCGPFAIFE